jgi:tetratricopeptide (TPR) repeat protein
MLKSKLIAALVVLSILVSSMLSGCGGSAKTSATDNIGEKLKLAAKYIIDNKFEEARLVYEEIIKLDKKVVKAYKGLALVYAVQKKTDKAVEAINNGITATGDQNELKLALGDVYMYQGNKAEAEKVYLDLIRANPQMDKAYSRLTEIYNTPEQIGKVITALETSAKDNGALTGILALAYSIKGDKAKVMELAQKAYALDSKQFYAFDAIERMFKNDGKGLIQLADQQLAQKANDEFGYMLKMLGNSYAGNYEEVIKLYTNLQNLKLDNIKAKILAAQSYFFTGEFAKAGDLINAVSAGDDPEITRELINYYLSTGDQAKAMELAVKLFELEVGYENYLEINNIKEAKSNPETSNSKWHSQPVNVGFFSTAENEQVSAVLVQGNQKITVPLVYDNKDTSGTEVKYEYKSAINVPKLSDGLWKHWDVFYNNNHPHSFYLGDILVKGDRYLFVNLPKPEEIKAQDIQP